MLGVNPDPSLLWNHGVRVQIRQLVAVPCWKWNLQINQSSCHVRSRILACFCNFKHIHRPFHVLPFSLSLYFHCWLRRLCHSYFDKLHFAPLHFYLSFILCPSFSIMSVNPLHFIQVLICCPCVIQLNDKKLSCNTIIKGGHMALKLFRD